MTIMRLVSENDAPTAKPVIKVEAGVRKETADAVENTLVNTDCDLFQRGGLIVRVDYIKMKTWDEKEIEIQAVVECGDAYVTEVVADCCVFMRYDAKKKEDVRCNPPPWIASTLKQRKSRLSLPVLNGVSNCPIMRSNGELVTKPGYNQETCLFYDPRGTVFPTIPEHPTKEEAIEALKRIKVLFHTFPFSSEGSQSVALSALLTSVARRALDFSPMHSFDSPTAGTGKSKIMDIVSIISTGDRASVLAITEEQKEFDKLLSAELMLGRSLVAIDNIEEPLKSAVLVQTLTQSILNLRILGKSELVTVRSNSVIMANGNNLIIQGDLTRRTIMCRMDAGVERPELLKFDYDPIKDAMENRAELVVAVLTVLRAFHVAGKPDCGLSPLGGFEEWSRLVRNALVWVGEEDPAATMEELRKNDPKLSALRTVMFEWGKIWKPGQMVTVSEMIKRANKQTKDEDGGWEYVFPDWRNVVGNVAGMNDIRLGKWLNSNKDRLTTFNNTGKDVLIKIEKASVLRGYQQWKLTALEQSVEKPGRQGELL